ncbi:zinc finger protein 41 homolog isoform X3 [Anabrus simplex]|uniref:zinc finger protein 41 homolog isoform X3 n=1 Tax=Anabrus simplex TaxID=316456 RepID=UPI0035A29A90
MLPASSAMGEEHKPYMSSDVKEDELDDLSTFDAHSWALNHLSVEIKDEPKEEPVSGVEPDAADVEEWRFDGDAAPSSPRSPGGDSQQGEEEEEEEEEEKEKECAEGAPKWRVHRRRHSNELWVTVITNHNQKPKRTFACQECSKVFSTKGNLLHHMRSHNGEQPFECQVCGRRFSFNCNLNTHLLTHSGTKPFKCDICEKSFVTKGNLMTHSRTHTGEKPFECPHCQKGFAVKDNLLRHLKTHQDKPEKSDKS